MEKNKKETIETDKQRSPAQTMQETVATKQPSEFIEKVLSINRVAKVTKGGKKLKFSALVVVGDSKGHVGCGFGKAKEVADAIRKALTDGRKNLFEVPLKGTTIPHEVIGHYGAGKILMKPAVPGTGVIAGGATRSICEAAGIKDVLCKCLGSNNAINVVRATMDGLQKLRHKNIVKELTTKIIED